MEEIELFLEEADQLMDKSIKHLSHELLKIRAGKASPAMLDSLKVEYYGVPTPLNQMASITTPDARSLFIKPWERSVIGDIERAIINSDLGLNPQNDGEQVIINVPVLTEERRHTLVKQAKHEGELAKVSIRNIRKETNDTLKKLSKDGVSEDEIKRAEEKTQKLTDIHIKKIDELIAKKETDIMHV
ncbi:MAG: ribosome recycling factor [Cyclobacteriaceae bacterium]|nr:ribosome recycling factor [Cyclobacteriaceae bacterium]